MSSVFGLFCLRLAPLCLIARTAADDAAVTLMFLRTKLRLYAIGVLVLAGIAACGSPAFPQQFGSVAVGTASPPTVTVTVTVTVSGSFTDVVPAVLTQGAPNLDFICHSLCSPFRCILAVRS